MAKGDKNYVNVPQDVTDYVERCMYDYECYKDVVATCMDIHKLDTDGSFLDSVIFKDYSKKMTNAYKVYSIARNELNKYVPEDGRSYNWQMNFDTSQLELTEA